MDRPPQIPGYIIEKHIGSGAMASVHLAIQQSLERKVALKIMATAMLGDPQFCERFLKEGKIVAQLNHPHIITIYDIGVVQNCYYMAMEYVAGGVTLKDRIQQGIAPELAATLLQEIASALGYAHGRGFVHRDVKPANILMRPDGSAVLSDFGIAKAFDGTQMTAVGATMGTPSYMSPEQIQGTGLDARSDLYSLGVVFFEMLAGRKPFQGDSIPTVLWKHVNDPVPRLPGRLAVFQGVVDCLLAKDPDDRYNDARALIRALQSLDLRALDAASDTVAPTQAVEQIDVTVAARSQTARSQTARSQTARRPTPTISRQNTIEQNSATTAIDAATQHVAQPGSNNGTDGTTSRSYWLLALMLTIPLASAGLYWSPYFDDLKALFVVDSAPPRPPQDEKTLRTINQLLQLASAHFEEGLLTDYEYPGGNATYLYQRVLEMDPYNSEAKQGLQAIADKYEVKARASLDDGDLKTGRTLVDVGLNAVPEHKKLLSLQQQINRQMQQSP